MQRIDSYHFFSAVEGGHEDGRLQPSATDVIKVILSSTSEEDEPGSEAEDVRALLPQYQSSPLHPKEMPRLLTTSSDSK